MADIWIVNASPLIVLAKAGQLQLMEEPEVTVLVPDAVAAEVMAGPVSDPARKALERGWGQRVSVEDVPSAVTEWSLGSGESAVIAAALQRPGSLVIVDDAEGRSCAKALGLGLMGTLGLVLRAHRMSRISSAASVIRAIREAGLFVDDGVVSAVLERIAGERWK